MNCYTIATQQEIAALFDRWNASLQTCDAEKVVNNHAEDSILLPTISNTPRLTRAEKEDYFRAFLENKPSSTIVRVPMNNFLVCFYAEETEPTHRVLVKQNGNDGAWEKAKAYFLNQGIPSNELASFTVENYGQAKIDGINVI